MRSILRIAAALTAAAILCGFADQTLEYKLNAYRGKPIDAVIARFGEPILKQVVDGNKVYYWAVTYVDDTHYGCKVRAILDKQDIVTNWGYVDCAF
jgi:hypothetical protein